MESKTKFSAFGTQQKPSTTFFESLLNAEKMRLQIRRLAQEEKHKIENQCKRANSFKNVYNNVEITNVYLSIKYLKKNSAMLHPADVMELASDLLYVMCGMHGTKYYSDVYFLGTVEDYVPESQIQYFTDKNFFDVLKLFAENARLLNKSEEAKKRIYKMLADYKIERTMVPELIVSVLGVSDKNELLHMLTTCVLNFGVRKDEVVRFDVQHDNIVSKFPTNFREQVSYDYIYGAIEKLKHTERFYSKDVLIEMVPHLPTECRGIAQQLICQDILDDITADEAYNQKRNTWEHTIFNAYAVKNLLALPSWQQNEHDWEMLSSYIRNGLLSSDVEVTLYAIKALMLLPNKRQTDELWNVAEERIKNTVQWNHRDNKGMKELQLGALDIIHIMPPERKPPFIKIVKEASQWKIRKKAKHL